MPLKNFRLIVLIPFLLWSCGLAFAHGDIHEKIDQVSAKIKAAPEQADLYVERAGYYKIDGDFERSLADYNKAKNLDPSLQTIDLLIAELHTDFGEHQIALDYAQQFLLTGISMDETYLLMSRIYGGLQQADSALRKMEQFLTGFIIPSPMHYVQAKNFALSCKPPKHQIALEHLNSGLDRYPKDLVISEELYGLHMAMQQYDAAIELCQETISSIKRKEYWQYLLAKAYSNQGKGSNALTALSASQMSIDELPKHIRSTGFIKDLQQDIIQLKNSMQ